MDQVWLVQDKKEVWQYIHGLLYKHEVKFFFFVFTDPGGAEVHYTQKRMGPVYPAILTEQAWWIKDL